MKFDSSFTPEGDITKVEKPPEFVYMHLPPAFASLVLTMPNAHERIPDNAALEPKSSPGVSLKLRNNGAWQRDRFDANKLDWNSDTTAEVDTVTWNNKEYSFDQIQKEQQKLLQEFFISILGSAENVNAMRLSTGLKTGEYLYRAITDDEMQKLKQRKSKYVTHNDPSANFESATMYNNQDSQAKMFADKKEQGYSGSIIRWRITDPLLYRGAGMNPPRIVPLFPHFLPEIEISNDGKNFSSLKAAV